MNFKFPPPPNSGHTVAKIENVHKAYGPLQIFNGFDFEINKGEKFAIVGPNGAGKSTFCRLVTAQEDPDSGDVTLGHNVRPSFFSQNHADELDPDLTILETVQAVASRDAASQVRNILGCFLFTGDDVFKKIGVLSGGERSRVALTCMLLRPANFLILDEPTNHLDMQSQGVLQRALLDYPGSVMIVSHNRDFLDPLVTKTLEFRPGEQARLFHGNIAYYLDKKAEEKSANVLQNRKPPATTADAIVNKEQPKQESAPSINRKDQRRLDALAREAKTKILAPLEKEMISLEAKIAEQEASQATLTAALSSPEISGNAEELRRTTNAVEKVTKTLELAYSRWSSLTEEIEQVKAEHGL
jgi:ATP-binding cassette subfamily F protein 3